MDFQKIPVNTFCGADWKTFKAITKNREVDENFRKKFNTTRLVSWLLQMYRPMEDHRYRKLESKPLEMDPVFIIGHWRSGTTFVHNVFACDKHFGYNTTYQTIFPNIMLFAQPFFKMCLHMGMPHKRPTDNLELDVDLPQEEEFALANMMPYSYYNFWFFPKHTMEYCDRFLTFEKATEEEYQTYKDTLLKLIKISLWNTKGQQFLSKNPPHTAHIKMLLEMFPNAKFIYLVRNPYTVFESTYSFYTNTIQPLRVQEITNEQIEANFVEVYRKMYYAYEEQKLLIPKGNLVEIKFEDFEADSFGLTRDIYQTLDLPGFSESQESISKYLGKKKGYKKNEYKYDDHTIQVVEDKWSMALDKWGYKI